MKHGILTLFAIVAGFVAFGLVVKGLLVGPWSFLAGSVVGWCLGALTIACLSVGAEADTLRESAREVALRDARER